MDAQTIINILVGLAGVLGGWILNNLKKDVDTLATKVQQIEVLVAGTYVKRDDMEKLGNAIFAKLDKMDASQNRRLDQIDAKLDGKQDKVRP